MIKFGPSGSCEELHAQNFKKLSQQVDWLKNRGVDLFEYSFGRGVNISLEKAREIGNTYKDMDIEMSVHAPYFINLATDDAQKAENNLNYIFSSLEALYAFQGKRCVFHPGSPCKLERGQAMKILLNAFEKVLIKKEDLKFNNLLLCPETMGKKAQIGTLDEVIEMCKLGDDTIVPCIDFGHLNARDLGAIKTKDDYKRIIDTLYDNLGEYKTFNMHVHFSKIQYTDKGELRHLTFEDNVYGPDYEPLIELFYEYKMTPYVVCESAGTQTRDSMIMKDYYKNISNE